MYREGLELCEENAVRLIEEADKIFQIGAFTAAFFLGFTAWEEIGKAFLFLQNWDEDNIPKKKWIGRFKDHVEKVRIAKGFLETHRFKKLIQFSPRARELFFPEDKDVSKINVVIEEEYARSVFNNRNSILFINYNFKDNKFESPKDFINPGQASEMISSAKYSLDVLRIIKKELDIYAHSSRARPCGWGSCNRLWCDHRRIYHHGTIL